MTEQTPGTDMIFATSSLKDRMDWSRAIAGAGNLVPPGFRDGANANPAKILLAVEYGAMLGLHPMAALSGIHVLDGKPTLSSALMSALVHKAGHKLRIVTSGTITGTGSNLGGDFTAVVTLVRADDPKHPFVATWTIDRAKRAGLWGKGNWLKYPETQMTWRGVSEVTKLGAPEVLSGVWYTPDELGATVDEAGEVIEDAEIVEQDHDGPNVTATMREPAPVKGQPKVAAATTRAHAEVLTEWASRIGEINDLDALIKLHAEAAERHVLDHRDSKGTSIEDVFLARRETILAAQAQDSAAVDRSEDYADDETLPF